MARSSAIAFPAALTLAVLTAGPAALATAQQETPPIAAPAPPVDPEAAGTLEKASRARLARLLTIFAGRTLRKDELTLADIGLATIIATIATEANPDDVWAWRTLADAALLGDPADPEVIALRREALDRVARLDPRDESVRLRRLLDVVEREPTAEARIEIYRTLLDPANRAALGPVIAGRLALDLAILLQRVGDQEGFERWLAEAATIDPSSPNATAMAAGYFRFRATSPAQEAELLLAAVAANPLDPLTTRGLATLLLDHGAYAGAARFLGLVAGSLEVNRLSPPYDGILADLALALWASGRASEALDQIRRRQSVLSIALREELAAEDPAILQDHDRLMAQRSLLPSGLAVARAAILHDPGLAVPATEAERGAALEEALASLEREAAEAGKEADAAADPLSRTGWRAAQASDLLNAASIALWLGNDRARASRLLDGAVSFEPLSDAAQDRFAAWFALRADRPEDAVAQFEALAEDSQPVRLGRGLAYLAAGRSRDAAREYLAALRLGPGTLLGVDARSRLAAILGQAPPAEPAAAELERLAASLPPEFDRMLNPDGRCVAIRLRSPTPPSDVFDSIPIEIEILNQGPLPLAIGPDGPIRELLLIQSNVTAAGLASAIEFPPQVISLTRNLVVPARGRVTVPIDLAHRDIAGGIIPLAATGCTLSVRGLINWEASIGGYKPGPLGDRADASLIRIDGERITREWLDATIAAAERTPTPREMTDLVAYAYTTARISRAEGVPEPERQMFERVWPALAALMPRLDRWSQAWLVGVLPDGIAELDPAFDEVRQLDDPAIRLAYLIRRAGRPDDPAIDAAIRSRDPRISEIGRLIRAVLTQEEDLMRRDLNLAPGAPLPPPGTDASPPQSGETPQEP